MNSRAWLIGIVLVLAGSMLFADQAVVKTRDGQSLQGELKENSETNVVLVIRGIETTIPKSEVLSVELAGDYAKQFLDHMNKLEARDAVGRVAMAREAFGQGRYDLAYQAAQAALVIDPNSADAVAMIDLVQSQLRLERAKVENAAIVATRPASQQALPVQDRRLLTPADVEAIRRRELRPSDVNVRIRFDSDVKKKYADAQNMPFADFNAQPVTVQAISILNNGTDQMRSQVRVLSDPESMATFRRHVLPMVIQNCATSACHGNAGAGGFMLYNPADNEQVAYTDFYILQNYSRDNPGGGTVFGGTKVRLIDRGQGSRSLLSSYGLPPNIGEYDHPVITGRPIAPLFRNKDDLRYQMINEWMDKSLMPSVRDYGIIYSPPLSPTPAPARGPQ